MPLISQPNQLAFLSKHTSRDYSSDPGLNGSNRPSSVLKSSESHTHDLATKESLNHDACTILRTFLTLGQHHMHRFWLYTAYSFLKHWCMNSCKIFGDPLASILELFDFRASIFVSIVNLLLAIRPLRSELYSLSLVGNSVSRLYPCIILGISSPIRLLLSYTMLLRTSFVVHHF